MGRVVHLGHWERCRLCGAGAARRETFYVCRGCERTINLMPDRTSGERSGRHSTWWTEYKPSGGTDSAGGRNREAKE